MTTRPVLSKGCIMDDVLVEDAAFHQQEEGKVEVHHK